MGDVVTTEIVTKEETLTLALNIERVARLETQKAMLLSQLKMTEYDLSSAREESRRHSDAIAAKYALVPNVDSVELGTGKISRRSKPPTAPVVDGPPAPPSPAC